MGDKAIVQIILEHAIRVDIESAAQRLLAAIDSSVSLVQGIGAVISRGGRPDLAGGALPRVQAPTLLIVGGADDTVIELNRAAMRHMRAHVELAIVPGATHLFEEPGRLEQVARLAVAWCRRYLTRARP